MLVLLSEMLGSQLLQPSPILQGQLNFHILEGTFSGLEEVGQRWMGLESQLKVKAL